jgi:hypothetical protein
MYSTDNFNWSEEIKNYDHNRKNLAYEIKDPILVTHKDIYNRDIYFNPVLQKYNDPKLESKVKTEEKTKLINTIVKNKDNSLRVEQYYDIINLNDKLKGLESHQHYPRESHKTKRLSKEISRTNYNILSNITYDKHHYLKPENRPKIKDEVLYYNLGQRTS